MSRHFASRSHARSVLRAAACAAVLASGPAVSAAVLWDGEAGTSWWYDPVNWNTNANDNVTLPNMGSQAAQATEINAGWNFLGDGVVFDPANDPSTGGPPATPDPYTVANLYLGNQGTLDNKLTIKSGTLISSVNGIVILSRNTAGMTGHLVQQGGNFFIQSTTGRLAISNAIDSTGIYEYHGGNFEANLGAAAGTAGVRIGGDSTSSGRGTGWFVVHNDGDAGHLKAANFLVSSSAGGTVGNVQFHLSNQTTSGNFGVRPVQVVNNLSLRNSATQSARLNIVLDEEPIVDGGGVPQNLGLFWLDDVTGNRTGATGSDPTTQIFHDMTGVMGYSPGATVRAVFGTKYYDWTIQYNGEIIFSDADASQVSSVVHNSNNNDVVLLGSGSVLGSQWSNPLSENWTGGANWSAGVPDGPDLIANFLGIPTTPTTVTVDAPVSAGHVNFDNSNSYNIAGANTVTLDVHGGSAFINVLSGSHSISAPLALADETKVNVASGSTLSVSDLQSASVNLIKQGSGTLAANNVRTSGSLSVASGKLQVTAQPDPYSPAAAAGVSNAAGLSVASGALLDITNNKLITSAAVGSWNGSAYTGVTGLVQQGRGTGTWNGTTGVVTSETDATSGVLTGIAVARAGDVLGLAATDTTTWAGQTINGDSTLVMYTWGGDAQMDGDLDGDDYFQIDSNVAQSGSVFGYNKGDFNYDGLINGDDYFIIDSNIAAAQASGNVFYTSGGVGGAGGAAGMTAVPEPASLGALGLAANALLARRRRRG